ncbi:SpoIIE family protein phosphatase [Streptomyces syringium]|uniref:SpoIIE family protein phosphatase n=1 Tax=Streptomyces syringium TaxID=76729 RepID=UPI003451E6C3
MHTTAFDLHPGDRLILYTDGLVETRHHPIGERLGTLLHTLDEPRRPLEETCQWLLHSPRHPEDHDDVAILIAQATPAHRRGLLQPGAPDIKCAQSAPAPAAGGHNAAPAAHGMGMDARVTTRQHPRLGRRVTPR